MTATSTVAVGLIGAGRIGQVHAQHLSQRIHEADLLMVADVREEATQQVATQFSVPQTATDHRAVLENDDINAVVICSATHTHARFITEAAEAGKHIFCEKPIALTLEKIDRTLTAVDDAGVKLQIGFNRRFDSNYRRVREAVVNGEIGEPHILHIISRDPEPPPLDYIRDSGGIFLDMTIHDFDMARFLIGSEVEEVYATGSVMIDPEIGEVGDLDTAVITLKFKNGVVGTIDNSRQAVYGYDQRVEVLGSNAAIRTENEYPNSAVLSGAEQVQRDPPLYFFMERYMDSYRVEMEAFIEAVRADTPVPVNGSDGRMAVVMALAAQKSYAENRPVRVAEIA